MKWQIKDSSKSFVVELPDSFGSDREFQARVGNQSFTCSWHEETQTLMIGTPHGPLHLSARSVQKEKFPGESESRAHIEYWNPVPNKVSILRLTTQLYAPGSEHRTGQNKNAKNSVRAPMTGKVLGVFTEHGGFVEQGQVLFIVEAMKMENKVYAPCSGKVEKLNVSLGQAVTVGQEMIKIEPVSSPS